MHVLEHKAKCAALRCLFVLLPWVPLCGCSTLRNSIFKHFVSVPSATVTTPGGASVAQGGNAQTPAGYTSDETTVTVLAPTAPPTPHPTTAPAGAVTVSSPVAAPASAPAPVPVVTITTKHETATGPRAFTPPPPPTPPTAQEAAQAAGTRWFYVASLLGVLVAGLLAWSGHVLAAVKVGAGSIALPILARFFCSGLAMAVSGILVAVGLTFVAAWYIIASRHTIEPKPPTQPSS